MSKKNMSSTYRNISQNLLKKFKKIVGPKNFFIEKEVKWTYAFGGTIFEKEWIPDLILRPKTSKQIAQILQIANKERIPIIPRGNGTSLSGGAMTPYGGIVLDFSSMNKILNIDIENNMVELEPGVICDDLNEELKKYGYFFPPDPGSSSVATVGGMCATNAGGVQAFKYGVTKEYVMYLELILPDGRKLKLGTEVLKSVSSYNIKDLFIGSEGTLGVITKIGLKIRPLPEYRKLGMFIFDDVEKIQEAVLDIRKNAIMPNLLEFMGKVIFRAVREYLGGEFRDYPEGYVLLAETDGFSSEEVENSFSQIFDLIIQHDPIFQKIAKNDEERDKLIQARKANLPAVARIKPTVCVEDCTIKITNFAETIRKIEQIPEKINAERLKVAVISHMEGNLHPKFLFNENNEQDLKEFQKAMDYLYENIIIPSGGSLTGEHGIGKVKTPYLHLEHDESVIKLMHQFKKMFDPNMILNPGIGKGDPRPLKKISSNRVLKNQPNKNLELNCIRCGFCIATCPSKIHYELETYSPRGRLNLLNGLVHGELKPNKKISEIFHSCQLCGLCLVKCPAGVETYEIFEQTREILHNNQ